MPIDGRYECADNRKEQLDRRVARRRTEDPMPIDIAQTIKPDLHHAVSVNHPVEDK